MEYCIILVKKDSRDKVEGVFLKHGVKYKVPFDRIIARNYVFESDEHDPKKKKLFEDLYKLLDKDEIIISEKYGLMNIPK